MRSFRLIAVCLVVISCGSSEPETVSGTGGASGASGATGTAGSTGTAGANGGTGGSAAGSGGTSAGGTGGSNAGNAGNAGSSGGAGTTGSAGTGGNAGTTGAGGNAGAGGTATGGRGGTGGAAGTGGASGGRGGSAGNGGSAGGNAGTTGVAGASGGRGGSTGSGGSAGQGGGAGRGGTGGAGGTGGGVTDGGVDTGSDAGGFNPCPATGNCIIMPLGDSITDGVGSSGSGGGYRVPLFQMTVTNTQLITFVGRNANGPTTIAGQTFPRNHEGYSGYTIDPGGGRSGISPLVDGAISMFHPHIVLLMIGTNDVNISLDLANAPTRLGALLDRITTDAPNALLVVARITPTRTAATNTRVQTYNNAIPGLVQTRAAAGKHIVIVDMYAAFTANANYMTALLNDDLHPNNAGYVVMAQTWYAAISSYLRRN